MPTSFEPFSVAFSVDTFAELEARATAGSAIASATTTTANTRYRIPVLLFLAPSIAVALVAPCTELPSWVVCLLGRVAVSDENHVKREREAFASRSLVLSGLERGSFPTPSLHVRIRVDQRLQMQR